MSIGSEVLRATDYARQGQKYTPPKQMLTQTCQFLLAPCDGKARAAPLRYPSAPSPHLRSLTSCCSRRLAPPLPLRWGAAAAAPFF